MKAVTIHLTHCKLNSLHTSTIHLTTCKVGDKDVVYNVLSDGTSILTDNAWQCLIAGAINVLASGGQILTNNNNYFLHP